MPRLCARNFSARLFLSLLLAALSAPHLKADDGAQPDDPVTVLEEGTCSKSKHKEALRLLPLNDLTPENRARVEKILRSTAVYREFPTLSFEVDPQVYSFFVSCPDVAVSMWRVMNISECKMRQTGPSTYEADAGDGSYGVLEVMHRSMEHSLVFCQGVFTNPLLVKPVKADAVIHLQTRFARNLDGKIVAKHRGHLFVSFPSMTVGAAAKLMTPVNNVVVDRNFHEISVFLHMMSLAMERNPDWVVATAGQLDGIMEVQKAQLVTLTGQVHSAGLERAFTEASAQSQGYRQPPGSIDGAPSSEAAIPQTVEGDRLPIR